MRPKTITYSIAAPVANYFVTTVTPSGAGSFTLAATSMPGPAQKISFTSDGDESGDTYTVTGTDRYGNAMTEAVTGPNTTTVYSTKDFLTVSGITTSGAGTGNITIGTADRADTQWIPVEYRIQTEYGFHADQSSGAGIVEIQGTKQDPFAFGFNEYTCDLADMEEGGPVRAVRASMTNIDGTNGLTLIFTVICS